MIVAIDGPAGAGKSTVARALANALGVAYLNTGAMYRALTLTAIRRGVSLDDAEALAALARRHEIRLEPAPGGERVLVDGEDVTRESRQPVVSAAVSRVAAHGPVRTEIVGLQREILASGDWVADGRDIGSVVCPGAEVKVFLTAEPGERARRRHAEIVGSGDAVPLDEVVRQMRERDRSDTDRRESPLVVAPGATVVDTSGMSVAQVVERLLSLVAERVA